MSNLLLLLVSFSSGVLLRKSGRFPETTARVLNAFIINISLPALILFSLHRIQLSAAHSIPATMPWMQFAAAIPLVYTIGKLLKWRKETTACITLVCGLGNTSFLGLPMIETFFGKSELYIGIIADQLGTFPALSVIGIAIAVTARGGTFSKRDVLKRIVTFPPFITVLAALLLSNVEYPAALLQTFERLGQTLSPLALASVGFQFRLSAVKEYTRELSVALLLKLLIFPVLMFLLYFPFVTRASTIFQVTIFEAAMPPMITAAIVATEYGLEPKLAASLVGFGILLSLLTLTLWHFLLTS